MKLNCRVSENDQFDDMLITQPNQAFTPRQILEQFARNEVVPSYNQSTDNLDDDHYNDDDLLDNELHEFEDLMEAQTYLDENQFKPLEDETKASNPIREGSEKGAGETTSGAQQTAE